MIIYRAVRNPPTGTDHALSKPSNGVRPPCMMPASCSKQPSVLPHLAVGLPQGSPLRLRYATLRSCLKSTTAPCSERSETWRVCCSHPVGSKSVEFSFNAPLCHTLGHKLVQGLPPPPCVPLVGPAPSLHT